MFDTLTANAPATDAPPRPDVLTPRQHPDVRQVEAELRQVRAEIEPLEEQRQQARRERLLIEVEQQKARDSGDYERLTRLTLEEDQIDQLGEQEHERLIALHSRAMRLAEKRDEVRRRVVPGIEDALERWGRPRLQELADACQRVLDLSEELFPVFQALADANHVAHLPGGSGDAPAVNPNIPMPYRPALLGDKGHLQNILRKLRQHGIEPRTDRA